MVGAVTWTITVLNSTLEDINSILRNLENSGRKTDGALNDYITSASDSEDSKATRKKDVVKILKDINFVISEKQGGTTAYDISTDGIGYLTALKSSEEESYYYLHSALYRNVIHYQLAYDYILANDFYEFTKLKFIEEIVLYSAVNFGTRFYDWRSGENVLKFMQELGIVKKDSKTYSIDEKYRKKFNNEKFEQMIKEYLIGHNSSTETINLCKYLVDNQNNFVSSNEQVSTEFIYKHILRLNNDLKFLKFIAGLPRPPIPPYHTVVKLKVF